MNISLRQTLTISGWKVADCKKRTSQLKVGEKTDDPVELLEEIAKTEEVLERQMYNHSITTSASTASQFVAMGILMEDKSGINIVIIFIYSRTS